jgi:hypothetical protein
VFWPVLLDCIFETEGLFVYLFIYPVIPLTLLAACCAVVVVVYQMMFDPNAVDVASRLSALSIDPDRWVPHS